MCSCRVPPSPSLPSAQRPKQSCSAVRPAVSATGLTRNSTRVEGFSQPTISGNSGNLRLDIRAEELLEALNKFPGSESVRLYVVDTVKVRGAGEYEQTGSAPNFEGGLGTLCTCKHQMRSRYSAESWSSGVWVLGLTGLSRWRRGEQPFYYLMRIARAYESQADLVQALEAQGRLEVLAAKDSRTSHLGDVFTPKRPLSNESRFKPDNYHPPMVGHAHSQADNLFGWHNDIFYDGTSHTRPPLLVGDPEYTFVWTRPIVRRRNPSPIRDYENWTLSRLRGVILGIDK